ncbi:MAG: hypothetical protein ACRD3J_17285 [Thermoanaerobaculia bacterium]
MNEQQEAYESMVRAKQEMEDLDRGIEEELANVKKRLEELQQQKRKAGAGFNAAWAAFEKSLGTPAS